MQASPSPADSQGVLRGLGRAGAVRYTANAATVVGENDVERNLSDKATRSVALQVCPVACCRALRWLLTVLWFVSSNLWQGCDC